VNSFALVAYLPEPLAGFVNSFRRDLIPGCKALAHVTILPPRSLKYPPMHAWAEISKRLQEFPPFVVTLGEVRVFPVSDAIYLSVERGAAELEKMHLAANCGRIYAPCDFPFHPHVTLGQELPPESVDAVAGKAEEAWRKYAGPRYFPVERVTFVQNTVENQWQNLSEMTLGIPAYSVR
jgi:2'-5' RNA ligase